MQLALSELRIRKDTSNYMFLVWFSELKFAIQCCGLNIANFSSTTLGAAPGLRELTPKASFGILRPAKQPFEGPKRHDRQ